MQEKLRDLNLLLEYFPSSTSSRGISDLNVILTRYTKILEYINSHNEHYKRASSLHYADINFIKDYIELAVYAETRKEKTLAFENACERLKKNIRALSILVNPQEELVAMAV